MSMDKASIDSAKRLTLYGILLLALGCGGDPIEGLIAQLRDADVKVRLAAVRGLANLVGEQATTALAIALDDSEPEIRREAIGAIGQRGPLAEAQLPKLVAALQDQELSVRLAAALAIQAIDPNSGAFIPVLRRALLSGEGVVFLDVGAMGSEGQWAVPTLIQLLSNREAKIRALSARTLERIGPTDDNEKTVSALTRSLKDPQEVVRDAAQQALRKIRPQ